MSVSPKDVLDYFAAALAPITAVAMIYIAYRQYRLEKLKWKHELYEKRLAIFRSTMELLAVIMRDGNVDIVTLSKFNAETSESYFLLGRDICDYLLEVYRKGVHLRTLNEKLQVSNLPIGEERTRLADESGDLLKWFLDQFNVAREKFAEHLALDK